MKKPRKHGHFPWTPQRIAAVKRLADNKGTAVQAAVLVGIAPESKHLVYSLADREGFRFKNLGRPRDDTGLYIRLEEHVSALLTERARALNVRRRDLAARLLSLVLLQGPIFITNLLDEEA